MYESLGQPLALLEARDPDPAEAVFRRHISDFRGSIASQD